MVILAGDHIYKMDYMKLVERHIDNEADLDHRDIAGGPLDWPSNSASCRSTPTAASSSFEEKPEQPKPMPSDSTYRLGSMGIYVFTARFLFKQLCLDATRHGSKHDFGRDVIPFCAIQTHRIFAYPFLDENRKKDAYWRDEGMLDAYYEANLDLVAVDPQLNLYDNRWPIRTYQPNLPPPRASCLRNAALPRRRGQALDSIVCAGSIGAGGQVDGASSSGTNTRMNSYVQVEDSILFDGVNVGRHAKIRLVIIDKEVDIPAGIEIGYNQDLDRSRGFTITEPGIYGDRQDARHGPLRGEGLTSDPVPT